MLAAGLSSKGELAVSTLGLVHRVGRRCPFASALGFSRPERFRPIKAPTYGTGPDIPWPFPDQ